MYNDTQMAARTRREKVRSYSLFFPMTVHRFMIDAEMKIRRIKRKERRCHKILRLSTMTASKLRIWKAVYR